MSLYQAALQGITLARQAMAQGTDKREDGSQSYIPTHEAWSTFYGAMNDCPPFNVTGAKLSDRAENAHALACCDAFRNAYRAYIVLHTARTLPDDARGATIKACFELGANTALCERFATFTDSELSDLVMWVTTYGMQMAREARVCSYCKSDDCFQVGCRRKRAEGSNLYEAEKAPPLPFPGRGDTL